MLDSLNEGWEWKAIGLVLTSNGLLALGLNGKAYKSSTSGCRWTSGFTG